MLDEPTRPAPPPLRRNRDFMLLWTSQVVSTAGTRVTTVAFPLLVLAVTGSPAAAGIVGFAQSLPFLLFNLPAGALVDRWNRKRLMVAADTGRALALGSVALAVLLDRVTVAHLALVAFVEGSLFVVFDLAEGAALPHLVPQEQLPTALAQNQARIQGADLLGQPLGGLLYAAGPAVPFTVDAATYLVSLGAVLGIRRPLQARDDGAPRTRLRADIAEGLRVVWRQPFLRTSVALIGGMNLVFNALTLVLIVRARNLGASPAMIGGMFALIGGGNLLGALAAPWVQRSFGERRVIVAIAWFWLLTTAVLVFMPNAWALGAAFGLAGLGGPPFNVVFGTQVYRLTPDRLLGRVRSTGRLVAWGAIPFGALLAGFLSAGPGTTWTLWTLAGGMLVIALATTFAPGMRTVGSPAPA